MNYPFGDFPKAGEEEERAGVLEGAPVFVYDG